MSSEGNAAAASYDRITRARTGDMNSKEIPFRHFNNYVKKTLIQFALDSVRAHCSGTSSNSAGRVAVLDLASGRGGDLGKWLFMQSPQSATAVSSPVFARQSAASRWGGKGSPSSSPKSDSGFFSRAVEPTRSDDPPADSVVRMTHYEGYDISPECITEAQSRFQAMREGLSCSARFEVADCFGDDFLSNLEANRRGEFHVVSIQFALHYACESVENVRKLVKAVTACLVPGGVVVITTVDPFEISQRVRTRRRGNAMFSIEPVDAEPKWVSDASGPNGATDHRPLLATGTGYHFKLRGFVDCVEYVVPIDAVRACMADAGMEEVSDVSKPFADFLSEYDKDWSKNRGNVLTSTEQELTTLYTSLVFRKSGPERTK